MKRIKNLTDRWNSPPDITDGRNMAAGIFLCILMVMCVAALAFTVWGVITLLGPWVIILGLVALMVALGVYASGESK